MAKNNKPARMNASNIFGFSIFAGIVSICVGTYFASWLFNIVVPIAIMLYYAYTINKDSSDTLSLEQKADSVYYMGFILTLVAMTSSLVALAYDDALQFNAIVINFGLALGTTILGLSIRIIWLQLSSQELSDAESILKERILKRSQALQDQTEQVVGSMTALSNQLNKVSEPIQANFDKLATGLNLNDEVITKLKQLDQSAQSAAESLRLITSMSLSLAKSSSELKDAVDGQVIENVNDLNKSITDTKPQVKSLNSDLSDSIHTIEESLKLLQQNIKKTDAMVLESETILKRRRESENNFIERVQKLFSRD